MKTNSINTVVKIMEQLPDDIQENIENKIRKIASKINDEKKWQDSYKNDNLIKFAKKVKDDIKKGKIEKMDFSKL
ncbi:MAG TPA: hypothetical protein PK385_11660 [Spirochaetota bacterium]|nr:hypothetical protein [Spirochaetota bacterium]HOS33552.1 hypothetical protein [Spirochaetota bacterium]HOS56698.1 hypothetical protein [Spirochaetota bacterium]HPK62973.1 hypothetical protein [Spirochaetota bacterium]HQF78974.1 hypothetical protein [Spirochaetota bacterium]